MAVLHEAIARRVYLDAQGQPKNPPEPEASQAVLLLMRQGLSSDQEYHKLIQRLASDCDWHTLLHPRHKPRHG